MRARRRLILHHASRVRVRSCCQSDSRRYPLYIYSAVSSLLACCIPRRVPDSLLNGSLTSTRIAMSSSRTCTSILRSVYVPGIPEPNMPSIYLVCITVQARFTNPGFQIFYLLRSIFQVDFCGPCLTLFCGFGTRYLAPGVIAS